MSINGLNSNDVVIQIQMGQDVQSQIQVADDVLSQIKVAQDDQALPLNTSNEEKRDCDLEILCQPKRLKTEHNYFDDDVAINEPEYRKELQKLLLPMWCLLCKIKSNSPTSAYDHYNSKGHNNKIKCWLLENSQKKNIDGEQVYKLHCDLCDIRFTSMAHAKQHYEGRKHKLAQIETASLKKPLPTPSPPSIQNNGESSVQIYDEVDLGEYKIFGNEVLKLQKFYDIQQAQEQIQKLYCDLCNLKLTSLAHATQHYSGRKHNLVRAQIFRPSGDCYYGKDGMWVRTHSKFIPKCTDNRRFGIGEAFLCKPSEPPTPPPPAEFWCKICNKALTSSIDLELHNKGVKHIVKADKLNESKIPDENLNLKYRLPSGAYYCDICDINFTGFSILTSHLNGKKHIKKQAALKNVPLEGDKAAPTTKETSFTEV